MMLMEMLALLMRYLLDILPFVTRDKKRGVVLDMRVVTLKGRVSFWIIVLGGVLFFFSFEGFSEDIMYLFFFSFFLRYIVLVHEVL